MFSCELVRGFATIEIVPTSTKQMPELVLYLPTDGDDVRRAGDAEIFLHAGGQTGIKVSGEVS
jgi:hypothetical protein